MFVRVQAGFLALLTYLLLSHVHTHIQALVAEANARLQSTKQKPQESRIAALQRAAVSPAATASTMLATERKPVAITLVAPQKPLAPALEPEQVALPKPEPRPWFCCPSWFRGPLPTPEAPLLTEVEEVQPVPEAPLPTKVEEVQPEWIIKMNSSKDSERRKVIHFSDTGGQPVFEALHAVFQSPTGSVFV